MTCTQCDAVFVAAKLRQFVYGEDRQRTQATADESFRGLCSADFRGHKNEVSNLEHVYEVTRNSTKTNTANVTHTQTTAKTYFLRFLSFYLMFTHFILKMPKEMSIMTKWKESRMQRYLGNFEVTTSVFRLRLSRYSD